MADDSIGSTGGSSGPVTKITDEALFDQVVDAEERVLVDFYADWCGPCQLMAPVVEELATETDVAVVKVDVEAVPQVADQYGVRSIPTFLGLHDGDEVGRLVGMQNKEVINQLLD